MPGAEGSSNGGGGRIAAGVLALAVVGLIIGFLVGHFAAPRTKTTTTALAGVPGMNVNVTQASAPAASPSGSPAAGGEAAGGATSTGSSKGQSIFTTNCASCHTLKSAGATGTVGPNLDSLKPSEAAVVTQVTNGGGGMPAFGKTKILSSTQIKTVAAYVAQSAGVTP